MRGVLGDVNTLPRESGHFRCKLACETQVNVMSKDCRKWDTPKLSVPVGLPIIDMCLPRYRY